MNRIIVVPKGDSYRIYSTSVGFSTPTATEDMIRVPDFVPVRAVLDAIVEHKRRHEDQLNECICLVKYTLGRGRAEAKPKRVRKVRK